MNGQKPHFWTYKTLRFNTDGVTAEWHTMPFRFPVMAGAAMAAQAYMLAEAERGHMVVVSLEPCEDLKPAMDRIAEHGVMLDYIKAEFKRTGEMTLWDLIHSIDPLWPNPWRDPDDPEGRCTCGLSTVKDDCPIHGGE